MKKLGIIGAVLCMIFLVSFFVGKHPKICAIRINNVLWKIELALTSEQHQKGLMERRKMCDTCGMLFIFDGIAPRNFWMKNTRIPLDMYFYNSDGELVDVTKNMLPEEETAETMNYTSYPAQYVMEVHAGSQLFQPEIFDPRECL